MGSLTTSPAEQLIHFGKKLNSASIGKDALIELLQKVEKSLQQIPDAQPETLDTVKGALIKQSVLRHKDKTVRALATACLGHVFRICAPETPYEDDALKAIFQAFFDLLANLKERDPLIFSCAHDLLQSIAKYKIFLLMLDLDDEKDFLITLFKTLFEATTDFNFNTIYGDVLEVLHGVLCESEEEYAEVLDSMLQPLLSPHKDTHPAAYRLAKALLQRSESILQQRIQRYFLDVLDKDEVVESELQGDYHELIYEVFVTCPEILLPIIPRLQGELQVDDEATRLAAVALVGRLLRIPDMHVELSYRRLYVEFLKRFVDRQPAVRLAMLDWAQDFLNECFDACHAEIFTPIQARLLDPEERIRIRACALLCEVHITSPEIVPLVCLKAVSERLRDKRLSVRTAVLQQLANVFRAHCIQYVGSKRIPQDGGEGLEWIPGKILRCCGDPELRHSAVEPILAFHLFPAKLSVDVRMKIWALTYAHADQWTDKSLQYLLRAKSRLQQELATYLELRSEIREAARSKKREDSNLASQLAERLQALAASFQDPSKAIEQLKKMHDLKDELIFSSLQRLLDPANDTQTLLNEREEILKRISSSTAQDRGLFEFMKLLVTKAALVFFSCQHVRAGLKLIRGGLDKVSTQATKVLLEATLTLLKNIARSFPALFATSMTDLHLILKTLPDTSWFQTLPDISPFTDSA
ncbi:hypothetical protein CYMTET_50281 [Cymbomonas tetramitiformis]|uniref:Uncharacterized protein n=1 Tax=Cymbomonas tetramitiformis TaxID=36881 RepID=A0AAE0BQ44_9CHLO|nr:hypothetical protein CYMTET_50281 [Cymbomonas tetramitiformis]